MATRPRQRIDALDMTKGVLVLLMVLYHSINYSNQYQLAFRYLSFLPSSFIFITGFLLAAIYAVHYDVHDSALYRRLGVRGAKLLGLFTALNVLATFIQGRNPAGRTVGIKYFFSDWIDVYVIGGSRLAAFEVLLPIAYLILLAPVLLWANARHRFALPVIAAGVLTFCIVSEHYWGESNANLNLLCTGILGMVAGRISLDRVNALGNIRWLTSLLFGIYFTGAIKYGFLFLMQVTGAVTALAFIFSWCTGKENSGRASRWLIVQGKYSLVAYIAQIGILQVLSRLIVRPPPFSAAWFVLFLGTLIAMAILIEAVDWIRRRSKVAEAAYKAVFA